MFEAYYIIAQAIQKAVKQIAWIDLDKGQLENPEAFNSIITPGILVGNSEIEWSQLSSRNQIGDGTVTVKLVLRFANDTHLTNPLLFKNLEQLALADLVDEAVLTVPGVLSRIKSSDYPSLPFYVVEQTYMVQFKKEPTLTRKTVSVVVSPFLVKPAVA